MWGEACRWEVILVPWLSTSFCRWFGGPSHYLGIYFLSIYFLIVAFEGKPKRNILNKDTQLEGNDVFRMSQWAQ